MTNKKPDIFQGRGTIPAIYHGPFTTEADRLFLNTSSLFFTDFLVKKNCTSNYILNDNITKIIVLCVSFFSFRFLQFAYWKDWMRSSVCVLCGVCDLRQKLRRLSGVIIIILGVWWYNDDVVDNSVIMNKERWKKSQFGHMQKGG